MVTKKAPTRKCGTTQPITEDDYWDDLFQHAAELGLIQDTGKRRDGQIVWKVIATDAAKAEVNAAFDQKSNKGK